LAPAIGIITDFNSDNFVRITERHCAGLDASVTAPPFGSVMQTLLQPSLEFWERPHDAIVLWTFPGSVIPRFNDVVNFKEWTADALDRDVDAFADAVLSLKDRVGTVFLPSWVAPAVGAQRPSIEMNSRIGAAAALLRMNLRLVERLAGDPGVVMFDTGRWLRQVGANAFSDKLWYLSKTPFSKGVFDEAAKDIVATLRGLMGLRRKVIVLDLDNTLWGGIVGDVGPEGIQLGGHDPIGEAYLQFQRELRRLSREGVVLAVVSKNEEAIAMEAIEKNPEMELRARDFGAWRINWEDKAENIVDLMEDLNLGLDSAVFLDDSPHERDRIRQALPDVLVPDWPSDPMDYAKALRELRCFESPSMSSEDRSRTAMYVSDRERKTLKRELGSVDRWLETLDLEIHVEPLSPSNLERTAQLLNKTNQMNLTTRRLSAQELAAWASGGHHQTWTFRVRDKIGDYGLCGIASLAFCDSRAELVDFVLSCRAMGRGVEEAIISVAARQVRSAGVEKLSVTYVPTKKNRPCIRWIEQQTWFTRGTTPHTFLLDTHRDVLSPKHLRITAPLG
jgi:FkbH-like protein